MIKGLSSFDPSLQSDLELSYSISACVSLSTSLNALESS